MDGIPVTGVSELVLEVVDLEAAERFYAEVLGFPVVDRWPDRGAVWVMAGDRTRIGLWKPQIGLHGGRGGLHVHFAMKIDDADFDATVALLRSAARRSRPPASAPLTAARPTSTTRTATSWSSGPGTSRSTCGDAAEHVHRRGARPRGRPAPRRGLGGGAAREPGGPRRRGRPRGRARHRRRAARLALVPLEQAGDGEPLLLGLDDAGPIFAAEGDASRLSLLGLREAAAALPQADGGLAAYAAALLGWHRRHRFCANCGAPTEIREAGHVRRCPSCGAEHHPRTDPVVIMLVLRGDEVLLGRQASWPPDRYSALAGFVEPGESLEEAVAREVLEESGVRIGPPRYVSSQPWPFPASLMLGFVAPWESGSRGSATRSSRTCAGSPGKRSRTRCGGAGRCGCRRRWRSPAG